MSGQTECYKPPDITVKNKLELIFILNNKNRINVLFYSDSPSYKHLKLTNFGHLTKIGQLEFGISLEPRIHKKK
jgi:hypothetical protein